MKHLSPLKSIRKFCLECCGSSKEVSLCTANPKDIESADNPDIYSCCPLYDFRFGHNPHRKMVGGPGKASNFTKKPNSRHGLDEMAR